MSNPAPSLFLFIFLVAMICLLNQCNTNSSNPADKVTETIAINNTSVFLDSLRSLAEQTPAPEFQKEQPKPKKITASFSTEKKLAKKVLDQLWNTAGNFNIPKPAIRIIQSKTVIAQYKPGSHIIDLEEKLFKVCASFGSDSLAALAFVIGHELAHVFQMDTNPIKSTHPFLAYDQQFPASIRKEKTADVHGIFLAYLAGYLSSGDIIPAIVKRLYDHFDLHRLALPQYDNFAKRQLIAEEVKQKADTLRQVFELSNFCTKLALPKIAEAGYRYILKYYTGAEIYHNLALNNTFLAMRVGNKRVDVFVYPFELQTKTNLSLVRAEPQQLSISEKKQRERLLHRALTQLDTALQKNPAAYLPKIHQACILSLLNQSEKALDVLSQLVNAQGTSFSKKMTEKIDLTKALISLSRQDSSQHEQSIQVLTNFTSSSKTNPEISTLASFNLSQWTGQEWKEQQKQVCPENILRQKTIANGMNQFHLYDEVPVFYLNDFAAVGWKTEGPYTHWTASWMGSNQLHLLSVNTSLNLEKEYASPDTGWLNLTACNIWIEQKRGAPTKNQLINIVE